MRKLIYFLDASRRKDYNQSWENPYLKYIREFIKEYRYYAVWYDNYYSSFPNTYRWLLSTFNQTHNIDRWGYDYRMYPTTDNNPCKTSLFNIKAKEKGYKLRFCEYCSKVGPKIPYINDMLKGYGEVLSVREIFHDETDNVIDFIYDLNFHDRLMYDENTFNSIYDKELIYNDAFKRSQILFSSELFQKYDEIWIVSDHGYADYVIDDNGDYTYWEHEDKGYGNPTHHSNPICIKLGSDVGISTGVIMSSLFLFDQTQLVNAWLGDTIKEADFVLTYGYANKDRKYPLLHYLIDRNKDVIKADFNCIEQYTRWWMYKYNLNIPGQVSEELMTRDVFDKCYISSQFLSKMVNYSEFNQ